MHKQWSDLIPYYVAGTLPPHQAVDLERHLSGCEDCRFAVQEWQHVAGVVRTEARQWAAQSPMLPPQSLIAAFSSNGKSHLESPPTMRIPFVRPSHAARSTSLTTAAAMIGVLLVAGLMLLYLASRPDNSKQGAAATKTGTPTKTALQGYTVTPGIRWTPTFTPFGGAGSLAATPTRDTRTPRPSQSAATPTAMYNRQIGASSYTMITVEDVQSIAARTPVRVTSAWFDGDAWVYEIVAPNNVTAYARDWQIRPAPDVPTAAAPIPLYQDNLGVGGYSMITLEQVGQIPAGTRVRLSTAQWNGSTWIYTIATQNDQLYAEAREDQIDYMPGVTPGPTATSPFDGAYGYAMITLVQVGDIPANTLVGFGSSWYDRVDGWYYTISTREGVYATANEDQLAFAPGVTPGWFPTAVFGGDAAGGYPLLTLTQVGNIPANTRVRISNYQYDSLKGWIYTIMAQDGVTTAEAKENQLTYAPGYIPGPTPVSPYLLNNGFSLMLLENVGSIRSGEPVQITSGQYIALEGWRYTVSTQDGRYEEVDESLLTSLNGNGPTPTPVCPYSNTLTRNCPQTQNQIQMAYLSFEHGFMLWRSDTQQIYALYSDNNTYDMFIDTWGEGESIPNDGQTPPSGTYRPGRGLGKVWANNPAVRSRLGWALAGGETGYMTLIELFNGNVALTLPDGRVMLLEQAPPIWAIVP